MNCAYENMENQMYTTKEPQGIAHALPAPMHCPHMGLSIVALIKLARLLSEIISTSELIAAYNTCKFSEHF